jgi:hypothetical protein
MGLAARHQGRAADREAEEQGEGDHCRFHGKSPFWLAAGAGHIAKGLSRHDRAESGLMSRLSRHAMGWKG